MSLEKELQAAAVKHFTDLKTSLKQVSLRKVVQQGVSCGLNALLDISCHNWLPQTNEGEKYL